MIHRLLTSTALALALGVSAVAYAQTAPGGAIITEQQPGEIVAEDIIGTNVRNAQNESIGSVSDLVLDTNGQVKAVLVSVGGFLGIGDKKVAVSWNQLQVRAADSGAPGTATGTGTGATAPASQDPALVVNMTKDQLKAAPEFKTLAQQGRESDRAAPSGAPATAPRTTPAN
jgi:sporulation protein YlmC with PRC-barrel domain